MLKGDLTSTPLAPLLLELANDTATGCLHINDSTGEEALVYLKAGLIYSASVPGNRPQLGAKLVSSGALAPEALSEALEAQRTELQGWRLGELLVHLEYVDQPVVEAFVKEQVSEALWDLLRWSEGTWKFRKNVTARENVGPAMAVVDLLETLRQRGYEWEVISAVVHGPAAVPRLSTLGEPNAETTLDSDAWSMLCKIDGERSVADLAGDCGYTLFEAGHIIVSLVEAGLIDIDENVDIAGQELYGATTLTSALAGDLEDIEDIEESTPAAAIGVPEPEPGVTPTLADDDASSPQSADDRSTTTTTPEFASVGVAPAERPGGAYQQPVIVHRYPHSSESFAASIARVSSALSDVLGETPAAEAKQTAHRVAARQPTVIPTDDADWQRRKRQRTAAAAELASAQALIETLRTDKNSAPATEFTGEVPKVLSRATERGSTEATETGYAVEEAARNEAEATARNAAEQFAKAAADEAERHAAQQAQQLADEQAAAEAERVAAEHAAEVAAEAERLRAEREAAELARLAAEAERQAAQAEAERIAAEDARLAAEAEAERIAAEEARLAAEAEAEAERQAAQAEADHIAAQAEAERIAAEDAERHAMVQAAAEAAAQVAADAAAERAAAESAALHADEAAAASALLVELANESVADQDSVAEQEPAEPSSDAADAPEADDVDEDLDSAPLASWRDPETTDTAALLRELSSLGGDDDRNSSGATPRAARPAAADKKVKKKIGLFGL